MTERVTAETVTMAGEAIHNPAEPRHFMRLKPVKGKVRIMFRGSQLAESARAVRVLEVGRDFYDPVFYLPRDDVGAQLRQSERTTKCPLKGETTYFDWIDDAGNVIVTDIAWSYTMTFDFAEELRDLVAFDAGKVTIEEAPAETAAS